MSQDNPNGPTIAEECQTSDQSHATQVGPANEQATTETQVAEPAMDEIPEDVAEEDADTEDALRDEIAETEFSAPIDAANSATPSSDTPTASSTTDAKTDDRCAIEKQPYIFDHCTVQIAIQLLPDDGDANGRMVVVGVRSHLDAPILRVTRSNELGMLPPLVTALLDELKAELPKREQTAREAIEKKKAEQAQRKSIVTASKTARGKKGKATLATAPMVANAATPDNRPRPEVQVTTAPQQQRGLF
jgi:hypothetical protein